MMKIAGINCFESRDYSNDNKIIQFAVNFDDGITIIYHWLDEKLEYFSMLSTGLSSSYLKTGKWPTKRNLDKRLSMAGERVIKNKNRYKLLK